MGPDRAGSVRTPSGQAYTHCVTAGLVQRRACSAQRLFASRLQGSRLTRLFCSHAITHAFWPWVHPGRGPLLRPGSLPPSPGSRTLPDRRPLAPRRLFDFADEGKVEELSAMLKSREISSLRVMDSKGRTALNIAVTEEHLDVAKVCGRGQEGCLRGGWL